MSGRQADLPVLTDSELRLLPLLTTSLSLNEMAQALKMPAETLLALTQSIYVKLGLREDGRPRLTGL
jgi:DNA-binding CsgD family transcriptional regulator